MFFTQLDKIIEIKANESIKAEKCLTMAEAYLQDHFPRFPVMPGVMMLEALTQASAWLVRYSEDFAHSMVVLQEAKQVKYSGFVEPGQKLIVTSNLTKQDDTTTTFKAQAMVDERIAVSARLTLKRYNLAGVSSSGSDGSSLGGDQATQETTDRLVLKQARDFFELLSRDAMAGS